MKHNIIMSYEELLLRQIAPEDLQTLRNWRNDPTKNVFLKKMSHISFEQEKKWYQDYLKSDDEIGFSVLSDGILIGSIFLYDFTKETVEAGKLIIGAENAHGKGYASKCMGMVSLYAFLQRKAKTVLASVNSKNIAAYKSYLRIGFSKYDEKPSISTFGGMEDYLSLNYGSLVKSFPDITKTRIENE